LSGYLTAAVTVFCLAVPLPASPGDRTEDKDEAAKVAGKVERAQATAHGSEEDREALRHFAREVAEYAALRARQLAKLGGQESGAQRDLAHALTVTRAKARPGDIFRPEVQGLFRRLIAEQLKGPGTLDARKAVLEGNPGEEAPSVPVVVRVNAVYPVGAAWSTVPPSVLSTLPPLPPSLQYRFVGRDLVLVDTVAQLIVDFLPAAAPDPVHQ
jgi:hypothetical protein